MGKDDKSKSWETILSTIRENFNIAKTCYYKSNDFQNISIKLPFGLVIKNRIEQVTFIKIEQEKNLLFKDKYIKQALFKIGFNYHSSVSTPQTSQRIELNLGKMITNEFTRTKGFYYYIDPIKKRIIVSYKLVSLTGLNEKIRSFIKECNRIKFLYCN